MGALPSSLARVAADLAEDRATPRAALTLRRREAPLASTARQREMLAAVPLTREGRRVEFDAYAGTLAPGRLDIFQVNLGKLCNMTCRHCHVDAGPDRTDAMMADETVERVIAAIARTGAHTVDITGGAPELCPSFELLVTEARRLGRHVMDRCNLTVLATPRGRDLPELLARNRVEVVASLPHYRRIGTDRQRGDGVFEASIGALRRLNAVGYGRDPELRLVLVTNPVGAFLPAGQASLEAEWKRELATRHGVVFDALYTLTNMPIGRFLEWLESGGNLSTYLQSLVDAFNPGAAAGVMCRTTLSVAWDGSLHDCDFNQMLALGLEPGAPRHLSEFDAVALAGRRILTGRHCFGCTAGAGSSCGGQIEPN